MTTLLSILNNDEFTSVDYTGTTFTVYLLGDRRYEITCTAHKETNYTDEESNYSEGECTVTVETVTFCDDIAEEYTPINQDFEDLQIVLGSQFNNEF